MHGDHSKIKILLWGLLSLWALAGMHVFMHNPGGAGLYLPFNAVSWLFAALIISCGLWLATLRGALRGSPLLLWLGLMVLLLLLPMAWSSAPLRDYALPRLAGLVGGGLLLFSLYQFVFSELDRRRILYLLLGAVTIELALGLVQFYLLTPGNWIGYNTQTNRPYGIFQQPNVMASFMATGLALTLWCWPTLSGRGTRLWGATLLVGTALLLVVLQSRVGQLGGLLALLMLLPWLRRRQGLAALWLVLLGLGLGLLSLYWGGDQAGAGGLSVGGHALHLLALCLAAYLATSPDRLGLWQL